MNIKIYKNCLDRMRFISFASLVCIATGVYSAEITNLTVNMTQHPSFVDEPPSFGWQLVSDKYNIRQSSYEIKIYTDGQLSDLVYSSGVVESSLSQGIVLSDFNMSPVSRYYCTVDVRDNTGEMTTSKPIYFDTGLMGDWSDARWLRTGDRIFKDKNYSYVDVNQTIGVTINTLSGNPGITFDTDAEGNCFCWQFLLEENSVSLKRIMTSWGGSITVLGEARLDGFKKSDFIEKDVRIKLEISGNSNTVTTYVNGTKVDEFKVTDRLIYPERMGFYDRSQSAEHEVYFKDVSRHYSYSDGVDEEHMYEDFKDGASRHFLNLDIVEVDGSYNGHIKAGAEGYFLSEMKSHRPIFYIDFNIDKPVRSVNLFTSAMGNYDAYVNGNRVGMVLADGSVVYEELKPTFTDYRHTVCYFSHDVTSLCKTGDNILGIELNDGYPGGEILHSVYRHQPRCVIAKMVIRYADGSEETIVTDDSWKLSRTGPLMNGDIYSGECFDARYPYPWDDTYSFKAFDTRNTSSTASLVPFSGQPLIALPAIGPIGVVVYDEIEECNDFGKIIVKDSWDGKRSFTLRKGETAIVDFGQNCAAVPDFKLRGDRGTVVKMRFAERLNDSGSLSRNNDGPAGSIYRKNYRSEDVGVVHYTLAGNNSGESRRPTSTYIGYRYCELTASADVEILSIESVPLTSSYEVSGTIATDVSDVDKIFENTLWGQYSNFVNIPTDCPSRNEKMGWTGDINLFAPTALYNANVTEFLRKWLRDLRDGQLDSGAYLDIAPYMIDNNSIGNTAWADAGIFVPWTLYMMSGNLDIIREHYGSMKRYMDYVSSFSNDGITHPGTGNLYGDWWGFGSIDKLFESEVFYARMAELMSKMASHLSEADDDQFSADANAYDKLRSEIIEELQSLYFDPDGLKEPTQSSCALAISFGVCIDREQMYAVGRQLADLVSQNGYKLNTGFVCTPHLLKALSDTGHDDLAYSLLLRRECPSWLYMIDHGATTFWEHWDGYTDESGYIEYRENSFNHYAYGAVVEWMYSHMAGIRYDEDEPGFRNIIFEPHPDMRTGTMFGQPNVKWTKAAHISPLGQIKSEWKMSDSEFSYDISVPANATTKVLLPMTGIALVNGEPHHSVDGVEFIGEIDGRQVFSVGSGDYSFRTDISDSVSDPMAPSATVYPNPVRDVLHIRAESDVKASSLYDISGRLVRSYGENETDLDFSSVNASGIYILRVETDGGVITKKIIKE